MADRGAWRRRQGEDPEEAFELAGGAPDDFAGTAVAGELADAGGVAPAGGVDDAGAVAEGVGVADWVGAVVGVGVALGDTAGADVLVLGDGLGEAW